MSCFHTLPAGARRASLALAVICVFTLGAFIDRLARPEPAALAAATTPATTATTVATTAARATMPAARSQPG